MKQVYPHVAIAMALLVRWISPDDWQKLISAPSGNRTRGKCLEGTYVTTTPMVLLLHFEEVSIISSMVKEMYPHVAAAAIALYC